MMQLINTVLGIPLGYIMYGCFLLARDYGWAILLFTLLAKLVMFPVSLLSQKNAIKMVKVQPQLEEIQQRHYGNKDLIAEEQMKIFKQEKYSPAMGCLPLLLQIPLILGLIQVVYNPLQHLFHVNGEALALIAARVAELTGVTPAGSGAQLQMLNTLRGMPEAFDSLRGVLPGFGGLMERILALNTSFLGLDLLQTPTLSPASLLLLIPLLSGLSAGVMCLAQNRLNVLQREQGVWNRWGMTVFLIAFSAYFAFVVPAGIGLYWIAGNLLSIVVMALCNVVYNPRRYIDYANRAKPARLTREQKAERNAAAKAARVREKADSKRFFSLEAAQGKQLVFYSEGSGFYKYFGAVIDYVTAHSDLTVHYVTGDPNDRVFASANPKLTPYYIGDRELIPFMMKMDADMVVMTMPDLGQYHIKRSLVRKDVEYVYMHHGMTSFHMLLREGALDHYDTILCNGPNHIGEVRETERVYKLPAKKLVEVGYPLLDALLESVSALPPRVETGTPRILIAPSWQPDNLLDLCLDAVLEQLLHKGFHVTVRPHPEYVKRFPSRIKAIQDRYAADLDGDLTIETDFSSNATVYTSDLVITDWSSIAQEFSYATKRPSLFINTPTKIMNPNYTRIPLVPLDLSVRDEIGVSIDTHNLDTLHQQVVTLLAHQDDYRARITDFLNANIYNIGHSAQVAGDYIIGALKERRPDAH